MDKIKILLSSKSTWYIIGVFVYQGLQAIEPLLGQGHFGQIIQIVLVILAAQQHPKDIITAAQVGSFGSVRIR